MPNSADIHLKPEVLARYGLPDIAYPVASADLKAAMAGVSELPLAAMLHGLQEAARDGKADWKHLEPAMNRLPTCAGFRLKVSVRRATSTSALTRPAGSFSSGNSTAGVPLATPASPRCAR